MFLAIPPEIIKEIILYLDPVDFIKFCNCNKRLSSLTNDRSATIIKDYWTLQYVKYYDYSNMVIIRNDCCDIILFKLCKNLDLLALSLKTYKNINELYQCKQLDLFNRKLTLLPPQIGLLQNLQDLWLDDNQLTSLP